MSLSLLGLPPVPPELKAITPFLQRADEIKKQDPIISYWCAYYAAQVGIGIKARDHPSRDLLSELLGFLETMKIDIGPHDAVDIESVSFAYVENFALKVFLNADNEDRNNQATRATAKKFLAAANFLEVLRTFPKLTLADSTEEKIRYAKWKAADIAKAFREGRKPAPGPPGWAEEQEQLQHLQKGQEEPSLYPGQTGPQELMSSFSGANQRNSPPRTLHLDDASSFQNIREHPSLLRPHERTGSGAHTIDAFSGSARGPLKKAAWTNEELEGRYTPSPKASPKENLLSSGSPESDNRVPSASQNGSSAFIPPPPKEDGGPNNIYGPTFQPQTHGPSIVVPSHGMAGYPSMPPPPLPPPPSNPPGAYIYAPSPLSSRASPPRGYPTAPPIQPEPQIEDFELTPEIVAKAQKRCRYAISALDYEDVETARNELRAALALLETST